MINLTDKRPTDFDEIIGQPSTEIIKKLIENNCFTSVILHGPPGTGKTSVAEIITSKINLPVYKLNGCVNGITDVKTAISKQDRCLLILDEIQYFNKKQQETLLPFTENKSCILIGMTTENPYHYIYDALRSRCQLFEFTRPDKALIENNLHNILSKENLDNKIQPDVIKKISEISCGDVRKSLSLTELILNTFPDKVITMQDCEALLKNPYMPGDSADDYTYGLISAFQKSIRGSDANAALFYLAKLLEDGHLLYACRRLNIIASEDIGMALPTAPAVVHACTQAALEVGMPEANIPLAHAVVFLATAPKSNTTHIAYSKALEDVRAGYGNEIPEYLKQTHHPKYEYPHDLPKNFSKQTYLPLEIKDHIYYTFGNNPQEQALKELDIWRRS